MSHDFRFSNLLGAPYRGGTLLLHGNTLLSPVGNRVTQARALGGGWRGCARGSVARRLGSGGSRFAAC